MFFHLFMLQLLTEKLSGRRDRYKMSCKKRMFFTAQLMLHLFQYIFFYILQLAFFPFAFIGFFG